MDLSSDDVTVSFVRDAKPVKLMQALEKQGMTVNEYARGIYYVKNAWFPMQVIVTSELNLEEHQWMKALTEKLTCDEAEGLLHRVFEFKGTDEEDLVDSVMTVSKAANREAFRNVKEEPEMYQFVRELFEDEIKAERKESRQEGWREANKETAKRLLNRGRLTHEEIAEDSDLSIEEVEELARELASDLQFV